MSELQTIFEKYHYPGTNKFREILKKLGVKVTTKDLNSFIQSQPINQVFNEKHKPTGHIVSFQYLDRVQMDIIDMSTFYATNSHYKYILLFIDVFSRKLWGYALKHKNNENVLTALEKFVEMNKPNVLISDNEAAFMSAKTQAFLKDQQIHHITCEPGDHQVLGIIDRVCRTIKVNIYKYLTEKQTTQYLPQLSNIIDSYNASPHRSLDELSPDEASNPKYFKQIFELNIQKGKHNEPDHAFAVGDQVRIRNRKKQFERAYDEKYSDVKTIVSLDKRRATFEDGNTADLRRLKRVDSFKKEKTNVVAEARRENKIQRRIAKEHLEIENKEFMLPLKARREVKLKPEMEPIIKKDNKKKNDIDMSNIMEGKRRR